jgi:predicted NAD/FAD-binding protein
MRQVAVIGSGISGLGAAYVLSGRNCVHLFEKEARLGGHTHTIVADSSSGPVALDTGFLVHNDRTYPNLVRLFGEIGVATGGSDMCFAVSCADSGLEYSSRGARGFFAQRRNLFRAGHLGLLREIFRFNREAPQVLDAVDGGRLTLGEFLDERKFGDRFRHRYLYPMASATWSTSLDAIRSFPAVALIRFLSNHGLLAVKGQPAWKVVRGGSHSYIPKLAAPLGDRIYPRAGITGVTRHERGVTIRFLDRPAMDFDEVVFACHGDEVLPLLADASDRERDVFSAFRTTTNHAWLHTDDRMLPSLPWARASWNYRLSADTDQAPTVTYHLNRLQSLAPQEQFCVTLNPDGGIDERRVLNRMTYAHPLYTCDAMRAQARWPEVSGVRHTHYCGAYWFYGFHEDGLTSALRVARALGSEW